MTKYIRIWQNQAGQKVSLTNHNTQVSQASKLHGSRCIYIIVNYPSKGHNLTANQPNIAHECINESCKIM